MLMFQNQYLYHHHYYYYYYYYYYHYYYCRSTGSPPTNALRSTQRHVERRRHHLPPPRRRSPVHGPNPKRIISQNRRRDLRIPRRKLEPRLRRGERPRVQTVGDGSRREDVLARCPGESLDEKARTIVGHEQPHLHQSATQDVQRQDEIAIVDDCGGDDFESFSCSEESSECGEGCVGVDG